jgi:rod shape-determining protein MreD
MNALNTSLILLAAMLAVFLESALDGSRSILGAQVDLLPALMVYAGLKSGWGTISVLALTGGLAFDTLSSNPLGISVLPLFAVGYIICARRELILKDEMLAQLTLGLFASAAVPLMTLVMLSGTRVSPAIGWYSVAQWLVMSLGGALATPVCFWTMDALLRALNYRPESESSFRPDREIRRGRN